MLQSWEFLEYRQEISISNEDRIVNPPMKNNLYRAAFSLKQAFRPGDLWREPGLWGIVFMQILVNLFWFSHNTLWVDEAYSALLARRSLGAIHQALRLDAGPPLYYDLLHFWRSLFGESPTALRSMSLFFAVIATVGLYGFVRTGWNRKTGILVAGLFAFSPLTIEYIHEVRNYTLLAAECIGFSWALYAYVLEGKKLALWLCGLCALAMVYTHNVGWFAGLAGGIAACVSIRDRRRIVALLGCGFLVILFYLPWLPTLLSQMENTERTLAWVWNFWSIWSLPCTFSTFIPGGINPAYLQIPTFPYWFQALNASLWIMAFILGGMAAIRQRDRKAVFVWLSLITGLVAPYLYSMLQIPMYLCGRTDYGQLPFWCLLIGYGISQIPGRFPRWTIAFVFLMESVWIDGNLLLRDERHSERDAILYLDRYTQSGDAVICTGLTRPPFEYALREKNLTFFSYPSDMEQHLAHLNESWYDKHIDLEEDAKTVLRQAIRTIPLERPLWIIYSQRPINRPLDQILDTGEFGRVTSRIASPHMGLRKLGEPISLWKIEPNPRGK